MGLPGGSGSRRPYLPGGGPSVIDRSIARTCLVSAPIEVQSTTYSAIAPHPGESTPPETYSVLARVHGSPAGIGTLPPGVTTPQVSRTTGPQYSQHAPTASENH